MNTYRPDKVLDALREVINPDNETDIVSQDMVKNLRIEGKKIFFSLVFPKSGNPFANSLRKACEAAIHKHVDKSAEVAVNIEVVAQNVHHVERLMPGAKNIIAIASGKGGVGKSTVASNIAVALAKMGYQVGLIDADVYGPSIPKMFHVEGAKPELKKIDGKDRIVPVESHGVKLLSIGFFVDPKDALVWRGPMATSALKQLIHDGYWQGLDYLLIDLPPGTGDVHLTLVQTLPVTGVVIVSTPQAVALADAIKGISMFRGNTVNVPVLGLVENMAWFTPAELPENRYYIFGREGCKKLAEEMEVPLLGQIPLVQSIREGGDEGIPAATHGDTITARSFADLARSIIHQTDLRNATAGPTQIVEIKNELKRI